MSRSRSLPRAGSGFTTILVPALLVASAAAIADAAPCPPSEMQFRGMAPFQSEASSFDSSIVSAGTFRVAYDLVQGSVQIYHCCSLGRTSVRARDTYDVTGVAPGTPVTLVAVLAVDGAIFTNGCGGAGCAGGLGIYIRRGADEQGIELWENIFGAERREVHGTAQLPVTIVAGQPETIEFELWGTRAPGGSHGAEGTGQIRFTGLSPGMAVVSCQGFAGQVVPVRSSTWGRLKVLHR